MDNTKKFKILIVDDEEPNIAILAQMLSRKYNINIAMNGQTALEMAHEIIPDLILLDVLMPGMSGFEVITSLKSSDITRNIPVIFITALDSTDDEERGLFLGAADYITKPFCSSTVRLRVRNHLQMVEYIRTIEHLSTIDLLTNISNRRNFDDRMKKEWEWAVQLKTAISILLIDLDNFKKYNDTYGHPQGDAMLRAVAGIFEQTLKRPADFVARWGGEEFAALLPATNLAGTLVVAERIRGNIEQAVVPCANGTKTKTTVSIGVNSVVPTKSSSMEDFIAKADQALYAAKQAGKNRVSVCN